MINWNDILRGFLHCTTNLTADLVNALQTKYGITCGGFPYIQEREEENTSETVYY